MASGIETKLDEIEESYEQAEAEYRALWTDISGHSVMDECQRLTGLPPTATTRKLMLSHHLSNYGPPCPECGKPFRTPKATFCAECGYKHTVV